MRKEIQEWIEKGNRTEAVRLLEEWVGKHPADEEEWLLLGSPPESGSPEGSELCGYDQ